MMNKPIRSLVFPIVAAFAASLLFGSLTAVAQSEKEETVKPNRPRSARSLTREDSQFLSVFKSLTGSASESTVKVQAGSRQIAVGTIVDSDGLVLTKASEMSGDLKCRLPNGELIPASVFGIDVENDLALLKIDADGLAVAPLNPVAPPTRGMWLASPIDQSGSLIVGVVGVEERKIPPSRAFIGIEMLDEDDDGGVLITRIVPNTPAQKARLREDDVIVKLDEFKIGNRINLVEAIGKYTPGSEIELTIKRKDEEVTVRLTLADAKSTSPMNRRSRTQNSMGSRLSRRGTNFPRAFQHDMALNAKECGGPVINLDGQIVGINIARSGRVSSLALPVDVVLSVIEKLKTGEFTPATVYADRIKSTEEKLADMRLKLDGNLKAVAESEQGVKDNAIKLEELKRMESEVAERLKVVNDELEKMRLDIEERIKQVNENAEKTRLDIVDRIKQVTSERTKLKRTKRITQSKNGEVERAIRKIMRDLEALKTGKKH